MDSVVIIGGYVPITLGALDTNSKVVSTSTVSFTGVNVGNASADRLIVVCIGACVNSSSPVTLTSATIGGVSATKVVEHTNTSGGYGATSTIISAVVPEFETADVVLEFSAATNGVGIVVYSIKDLQGYTADSSSTSTSSVNIVNGGVCLTTSCASYSSGNESMTVDDSPTNLDSQAGNRQSLIASGKNMCAKDHNTINALSGYTNTVTISSGSGPYSICRATWGN